MKIQLHHLKSVLFLCLILTGMHVKGQATLTPVTEWTMVAEEKGVQLSYVYTNCEIPEEGFYAEYIYLSYKNTNNYPVKVSWFNDKYYGGACVNCDHDSRDRIRSVFIEANETISGKCELGLNNGLRIHRKWLQMEGRILEKAIVTDISVTPQPAK